jgi:putative phosphoesterase
MKILLISDIHANYPALKAVVACAEHAGKIDMIWNCGDMTVYAPFPNETMAWLREHNAISILGNTDKKVLGLAQGTQFKKPSKPEKRIMYTWTFDTLTKINLDYLQSLHVKNVFQVKGCRVGLFHGSPEDPDEFLFPDTPEKRFCELAKSAGQNIVCCGHSHTPFHKVIQGVHFINPGSVGRMFDGNPAASFAILRIRKKRIRVMHYRVPWHFKTMKRALKKNKLPEIYIAMYKQGRKLN